MEKNNITNQDKLPNYFVTAMDLEPEDHVRVQAAIQKWTDSSISKTANAPESYTVEQVDDLYFLGYDLGLKGITIYRDGSRQAQVLATKEEDAKIEAHIEAEQMAKLKEAKQVDSKPIGDKILKRPSRLFGLTEKMSVTLGERVVKVYVTINVDDEGQPFEVFIMSNDAEVAELASTLGRLITQFLRYGKTKDNLEQTLKHLRSGQSMTSLTSSVARILEGVAYGKIEFPGSVKGKKEVPFQVCSVCEEKAYDKVNCICHSCGQSQCN